MLSWGSQYTRFLHKQRFLPQHCMTFYRRSVDHTSPLQSIRTATWWMVCIGDGAWSPLPLEGWSVCSALQLGSWEVRARECFWIIPHDKLHLIETPKNICYYSWSFIAMVTRWKVIPANFDYVISFFPTTKINCLLSMSFSSAHLPWPSFLFFNLAEWPMSSSHAITFVKLWHEHPVPPHIMMFWSAPFFHIHWMFFLYACKLFPSPSSTTTFMFCESMQLFLNSHSGFLACHFHHFFHSYKHEKQFFRWLMLLSMPCTMVHPMSQYNLDHAHPPKLSATKLVGLLLVLIQPYFPFSHQETMENWGNPVSQVVMYCHTHPA